MMEKDITMKGFLERISALGPVWLVTVLAFLVVLPSFISLGYVSLLIEMLILASAACGLNLYPIHIRW